MKQNIDTKGRTARGGIGLLFLLTAGCLLPYNGLLAGIFLALGLFSGFEAYRG